METLHKISRAIDKVTALLGQWISWLILLAVLVSAANASIRKAFDISSNAWLELQWYLFGAVFMLAAAYTLQRNEHVRIDIFTHGFSKRTRDWIDLFGHVFLLSPFVFLMAYLSWPFFWNSFVSGEMSTNAGGLILWPAKGLVFLGFAVLCAQAISEIIKRALVLKRRHLRRVARPRAAADHRGHGRPRDDGTPDRRSRAGRQAMMDTIAHNLAPIMFVSVMAMLVLGYPVAFTLASGGLIFFVIGVQVAHIAPEQISLFWPLLQANPERVFGVMSNDTLLAIPFFTFMGIILERSRMAEDLLDTIGQLFGPIRGGLAFAAVLVGALLAATTGVVAASVIAMGLISLPIMTRYGYDSRVATGTIAAAGSLAQIIPPSLVLIVMADQLGRSVGDMYAGAIYPGLLLVALYCAYVFTVTLMRPKSTPALPAEARTLGGGVTSLIVILAAAAALYFVAYQYVFVEFRYEVRLVWAATTATALAYGFSLANRAFKLGLLSRLAEQVVIVLIPPLALIFLVLGTIFLGIATPTEGGAMGASGALALAFAKRRLNLTTLKQALDSTTKLASFVMFILIGARVFGLTFYGVNGNVWISDLLLGLPGGEYGFLTVVTIIIFILGCFLDFFEIAFILVPLLAPVADKLGIDLIWFGIILGLNLQASFLTPPFGFALFYLRSIAPNREWFDKVSGKTFPAIRTVDIYRGAIPFIAIQVAMIAIVIAFPWLVTHYKDEEPNLNPANIRIELPPSGESGGSGPNFNTGPNFGTGGSSGDSTTPPPPNFGTGDPGTPPPPNFGAGGDTATPPPPNFGTQ